MNTISSGEFSDMSDLREIGLIAAANPEAIDALILHLFGKGSAISAPGRRETDPSTVPASAPTR